MLSHVATLWSIEQRTLNPNSLGHQVTCKGSQLIHNPLENVSADDQPNPCRTANAPAVPGLGNSKTWDFTMPIDILPEGLMGLLEGSGAEGPLPTQSSWSPGDRLPISPQMTSENGKYGRFHGTSNIKKISFPDITQHMPIPEASVSPWWSKPLKITAGSDAAVTLRIGIMDPKNLRRTDLRDDEPTLLRECKYPLILGGFLSHESWPKSPLWFHNKIVYIIAGDLV